MPRLKIWWWSSSSSSVAPQGWLNETWLVLIIRIVEFRTRRKDDVLNPFALVRVVVEIHRIFPALTVGRSLGHRQAVNGLRRRFIGDVFQLLFFFIAVGRIGGKEIAVTEGATDGSCSWSCSGSLDLACGVMTRRNSARNGGEVVREIELGIGSSYTHQGCVVSVCGFFGCAEWAQPNARSGWRVSDLRHPFPPSPHSYSSVPPLWAPASLVPPGHDDDVELRYCTQ